MNRILNAAGKFAELHASDPEAFGAIEASAAPAEGGKPTQPTMSGLAYSGGLLNVDWGHPVLVDLTGLRAADSIVLLKDHDRRQLVGQATAQIKARSVTIAGNITGNVEDPQDPAGAIVMHARGGFKWPLSVGIWPEKVEEVAAGAKVSVNGRSFTGPLFVVGAGVLREVSFVTIGGDENTSAKVAASAAGETNMEPTFVQWLTAQGKDAASLSDAGKAPLQAAYDALKTAGLLVAAAPVLVPAKPAETPAPGEDPAKALRASQAAEWKRQGMISAKAGKYPDLAAKATEEGWDEPRLTAEVKIAELQAARPKGPAIITHEQPALTAEVCEASLCAVGHLPDREKQFSPETLESSQRLGRIGLQEIIMLVASIGGWAGRMTASNFRSNHKAILHAAFGTSSIDISGILSNVANKFLLQSFNVVETVWRRICAIRPANDFKTMTRYRMTMGGSYAKIGPDGEIKHGNLSEESRTNKVETYGEMLTITRQDQYNDDMNALTQIPAQLGGNAGRALNTAFWTEFMDNTSFFHSSHANVVAGSGAPFYLLIDPAKGGQDMAVMEVAFLDGRDTPVVESAEADFNKLGIQMRSYHDWGCAKAEYRGGVKSINTLSLTTLEAAEKIANDQTMDGTHPLGLVPNILLVPTSAKTTAMQIYKADQIRDTSSSTKIAVANVYQSMYEPLCSAYLANS